MPNITIKKVTLSDIDQLQKISIQTFSETFAAVNTEENIGNSSGRRNIIGHNNFTLNLLSLSGIGSHFGISIKN